MNNIEDLNLISIQNLFRRQLDMVRRNVAAVRMQYSTPAVVDRPARTAKHSSGAETKGTAEKKERRSKSSKSKSRDSDGGKKKSHHGKKKSSSSSHRPRAIKYWEALMRVDPSLTAKEAKKIAAAEGE